MTIKDRALRFRLAGQTYGEIRSVLGIPKSTQSSWFKNLLIPPGAKLLLEKKRTKALIGLSRFNEKRTNYIRRENEHIRTEFEAKITNLHTRDLMLIGAALYWAEGYKNFNQKGGGYPYVCFTNSNPKMIRIFIGFLEKILDINKSKMRGEILIHPNLSAEAASKFWQDLTKIPRENIKTYRALSRASGGKRPKNLLPFGTFQIRINSRKEFFKIKGLVDGIIKAFAVEASTPLRASRRSTRPQIFGRLA